MKIFPGALAIAFTLPSEEEAPEISVLKSVLSNCEEASYAANAKRD